MPYCDHNATAPLRPLCRDAITRALNITGNPSSVHANGRAARAMVEDARDAVAKLVQAKSEQVIFVSGASEANVLALWGAVEGASDLPVTRIMVAAIEHKSVIKPAEAIAARLAGVTLELLPVTADGVVDMDVLRTRLASDEGRALVAIAAANNETGVIQPVEEISQACRAANALLLVDAVTAAGKCALDARLCDYMTLSAHKLGGPQGVGALILGEDAPLKPLILGGGQQKGRRAGTENLSGIAGFGAAARSAMAETEECARVTAIRDHFETALTATFADVVIFGAKASRLGNTANVALPGLKAESIVIALDLEGVMVSSGASCSSGKISPSHVLVAMGASDELAGASIRVSFGWNSTLEDADAVVSALMKLEKRARARQAA